MTQLTKTALVISAVVSTFVSLPAQAFPIAAAGTEGLGIIVTTTDNIIATYEGNSASHSNDLLLNGVFIFNNQASPVGSTVDLGPFAVGTELVFELFDRNTNQRYFTGPAARNPDNTAHARVQTEWQPGITLVSFEDLFNGPFDYNDLSFSFTGTRSTAAVSAPGSLVLALAGLALLFGSRRAYAVI